MWIKGTHIKMIRGDSETLSISCTRNGESYMEVGDTVYLTIKKSGRVEGKLLQKIVTVSDPNRVIISIDPEDTKSLEYAKYKYDIQLTKKDGTVKTIVPASYFEVEEEITYE